MTSKRSARIFFAFTVSLIAACMIIICLFSGFKHETVKFKNILISLVIAVMFQLIIADPIKFVLLSIDKAFWPPLLGKPPKERDDWDFKRVDFLKLKLVTLRNRLIITEEYRNQKLNEHYKLIAQDLWLYGMYFILLMCMVLVSRDETLYYNTYNIERLFMENHTDYYGLNEVHHLSQLFDFIHSSLVVAFDPNSTVTGYTNWVHGEQTNLLGVIRLRQLRVIDKRYGWRPAEFSELSYMPDWQLPHRTLFYTDKYWRIYEPWLPISVNYDFLDGLLLNFEHVGYFQNYPELKGYVALLARSRQNSIKVMDYLTQYHWLNYNTCAVFMDFTLYNVDVNMFTVCTLRLEQTPFGGVIPHAGVESVKMLENLDQMSYLGLLVVLLYMVAVIQFSKSLALKLWYEPKLLTSNWNKLDLIIVLLNLSLFVLIILREWLVYSMLKRVEGASKMEFIDFRRPARLHELTTILIGFLICITTLRLWRVLLFASVFKLFSQTLYLAWQAVASTAMVIIIFLIGFCLLVVTINGNNSNNFNRFVKSVVTCVSFSFGFSAQVNPADLFNGGRWLGIVLYTILAFVVAVLLINVFVSLINDYFTTAKLMRDAKSVRHINFLQFLRVEYAGFFNFFLDMPCFRRRYRPRNRTVTENIDRALAQRQKGSVRVSHMVVFGHSTEEDLDSDKADEETLNRAHKARLEQLINLSALMRTQMELLELLLFDDDETKRDLELGQPQKDQ